MLIKPLIERKLGVASYLISQDYRSIYSIRGQVQQLGKRVKADVQLYSKITYQLIDITQTDDDGFYSFSGLQRARKYFVVSHHPDNKFNAVIQDNVVPK